MTDFSEVFNTCKNVPKDAGSEENPFPFHVSDGERRKSLNFFLQYGKASRQYIMHIRNVTSQAITLKCSHSGSKHVNCKGLTKMTVLDPKIIKFEERFIPSEERYKKIYMIDYEYPDLKDIKKYGKAKTLKPHSCTPTPRYFAVKRDFRTINGNTSVSLNKDQTQSQFDNSNLLDLMSTEKLAKWSSLPINPSRSRIR